ncbi:hypothetical protein D0Z08_07390 [Nocardioides immobilis]|uniref:DUF7948 domain-containing protein n=1 Tax=Nocardioides immobilis TaxID=2049295 RepID=A0A417Y4K0_9ACTN|nr:hypothetical protein [Nocardioides immobilis]RHW27506.1 hypothetical protein D0Z08_07390 [Nocardioides immobilis]
MLHLLTRPVAAVAAATLAVTAAVTALTFTQFDPDDVAVAFPDAGTTAAMEDRARRAFDSLPLAFEVNRGQTDAAVEYLAQGSGFTLFLTENGAVFDLRAADASPKATKQPAPAVAVALDPVGANPAPRLVGRSPQSATSSYFLGDDPSKWQRGVPAFGRVRYQGLYPGVDMVFRGDRSGAEYDFVVAPGTDPARIGYRLRGAEGLALDDGHLVATTAIGDFVHRAPVAFQRIDGERRRVDARYRLVDGVVSFDLGAYDHRRPLVIDPATDLEYSTYLGGGDLEVGHAIGLDDGDAYIAGSTLSTNFPTTTGPYPSDSGSNIFVSRISPDGAGTADLVSSAVVGGSASESGLGMALDGGDAYVTGITRSSDFPATSGAFDESHNGLTDTFLARLALEPTGSADLTYATLLGGSDFDDARAIAVEGGDAYLAGEAQSSDYPTTEGAFDRVLGGLADAVLTRISPDGAGAADLVYSTYLGGDGLDSAWAIAMDGGDAYLTGSTWDVSNFPTTVGAFDRTLGGPKDAYLTRISPGGAGEADLVYSTYLGGPSWDQAEGIAVADGDAYIVGSAASARFPTTAGAYDRTFNGENDAFVARISPDSAGTADLRYSTFLGGRKEDWVNSIVVDGRTVDVVGGSESAAFPTTVGALDRTYGGGVDGIVARLTPAGRGKADLKYSTFFGGNGWDTLYQLAPHAGALYVAGWTDSTDLRTTDGAYDTVGNSDDAFLIAMRVRDRAFRPDAWIRRDVGGNVGDDIYNTTGEGQTRRTVLRPGWREVYVVTAQNDDDVSDRFRITGPGSSRAWVVRYFRAGENITRQVTGRGYRTGPVPADGELEIKVRVKARLSAPVGARKSVLVLVTSLGNTVFKDAVKARPTVIQ